MRWGPGPLAAGARPLGPRQARLAAQTWLEARMPRLLVQERKERLLVARARYQAGAVAEAGPAATRKRPGWEEAALLLHLVGQHAGALLAVFRRFGLHRSALSGHDMLQLFLKFGLLTPDAAVPAAGGTAKGGSERRPLQWVTGDEGWARPLASAITSVIRAQAVEGQAQGRSDRADTSAGGEDAAGQGEEGGGTGGEEEVLQPRPPPALRPYVAKGAAAKEGQPMFVYEPPLTASALQREMGWIDEIVRSRKDAEAHRLRIEAQQKERPRGDKAAGKGAKEKAGKDGKGKGKGKGKGRGKGKAPPAPSPHALTEEEKAWLAECHYLHAQAEARREAKAEAAKRAEYDKRVRAERMHAPGGPGGSESAAGPSSERAGSGPHPAGDGQDRLEAVLSLAPGGVPPLAAVVGAMDEGGEGGSGAGQVELEGDLRDSEGEEEGGSQPAGRAEFEGVRVSPGARKGGSLTPPLPFAEPFSTEEWITFPRFLDIVLRFAYTSYAKGECRRECGPLGRGRAVVCVCAASHSPLPQATMTAWRTRWSTSSACTWRAWCAPCGRTRRRSASCSSTCPGLRGTRGTPSAVSSWPLRPRCRQHRRSRTLS